MARGSIVKRKSGNYAIVYYINKKQRWKTIGPNKKEAERALCAITSAQDRGEYGEIREITFKDFALKWLEGYTKGRVKESTYRFYKFIIVPEKNPQKNPQKKPYLIPYFGERKLTQITPDMIEAYLSERLNEGKLSKRTIAYHLTVLRMLFKRAILWGYLRQNPAEKVEGIRPKRREMEFLREEEVRLFLPQVRDEFYPLFLTAVLTGMRQGEILALKWGDISWATNQIHVRRSLDLNRRFTEPKTEHSIRIVPMSQNLALTLKKHQLGCEPNEHDLVFARYGKPVNARGLLIMEFRRALRKAGLRKIRFHDLRHTFAVMYLRAGGTIKDLQYILGHASATTTLKYLHYVPEDHSKAVQILDTALFPQDSAITKEDSLAIP